MSAPLVTCAGVARTFGAGPTAVVAVHDVTCVVSPQTRAALVGSSGSGKSTLLHLLAGLDTPTAGTLSWPGLGGSDHPRIHPGRVGLVFQGPSLIPSLTVADNVALPLLLGDAPEAGIYSRAVEALAMLGIAGLRGRLPEELSGGQTQRVAVARVLAAAPALVLADEPTGQLDHETAATVMDALLTACDEGNAALVVATHDPLIAGRLPEQWHMSDGALTAPTAVLQ
ncbi:MAG TPA: ATP-binding cassette domain-containing protein [Jatrophihabitantaceae bacterium]